MAEEEIPDVGQQGPGRKRLKMILMIAGAVVLVAGISVAATWFMLRGTEQAPPAPEEMPLADEAAMQTEGPATYLAMEPAFIVNYSVGGRTRFLQLQLSLLARDAKTIDTANAHMPLIRNNLLETLTEQDFQTLRTPEGKEQLVEELTATVQDVMEERLGRPGVETVLFRSFVMQ